MNISERQIRIAVSDIVTDFRHHFFNPSACPDIQQQYQNAISKLDGLLLIFKDGKIARFIKAYQDELRQLGQVLGLNTSTIEVKKS